MKQQDFLQDSEYVQRLYCSDCKNHLDLSFTDFHEVISDVEINITDFPTLHCNSCQKDYLPDDSRSTIIYLYEQAIAKSSVKVNATRNKPNKNFGLSTVPLDEEVFNISVAFNAPLIDTDKERRHIADSLNKIYIESFDNKILGSVLTSLNGNPKNLGSLKRLQKIIEIATLSTEVSTLMSSFYVLYDLRVAYSHLGSKQKNKEKLSFVKKRLNLSEEANLFDIYNSLVNELIASFEKLAKLLTVKP